MNIPTITNENIYNIFKLDDEDKKCINIFKLHGEGRLTDSKIKEFKNWKLGKVLSKSSVIEPGPEHIPDVEGPIPISPKPKSKSKPKSKPKSPKPKKTINKSKCSKLHPPIPCKPGMYNKDNKGCCYKVPKTKKKKGGHRHRRNKRSRRKSRKRK